METVVVTQKLSPVVLVASLGRRVQLPPLPSFALQGEVAKYYIDTLHCPACMKVFSCREYILQHVSCNRHQYNTSRGGRTCFDYITTTFRPLSTEAIKKNDEGERARAKGSKRAHGANSWAVRTRAYRIPGPFARPGPDVPFKAPCVCHTTSFGWAKCKPNAIPGLQITE